MKKILVLVLLISIGGVISLMGVKAFQKLQEKRRAEVKSGQIPGDFRFLTLDSMSYTFDSLEKNKPQVIIYFNTDCDYCQHEIRSIVSDRERFENASVLCISLEKPAVINRFREQFDPEHSAFITFLYDPDNSFFRLFGTNVIPSTFVYDATGKLQRKYMGEVSAEALLKWIR